MLFNHFSYANLRNEAHVQLREDLATLVTKYTAEAQGIAPLYELYLPLLAQEKDS